MKTWRVVPSIVLMAFVSLAANAQSDAPTLSKYQSHERQARYALREWLDEHPNDAKARYVMAELYANNNEHHRARSELDTATRLAPGLPFARPDLVHALTEELSTPDAIAWMRFDPEPLPMNLAVSLVLAGALLIVWILHGTAFMKSTPLPSRATTSRFGNRHNPRTSDPLVGMR